MEIGCHDESADFSRHLHETGYNVIGVDLREPQNTPNHPYLICDWCNLPQSIIRNYYGSVDAVTAISCIEHFGLGTYQEMAAWFYDVLAVRQAWQILRTGGHFYVSVPFGARMQTYTPHWRVYDYPNLLAKIVQDFAIEYQSFFFSAWGRLDGASYSGGEFLTQEQAMHFDCIEHPHITVFMKLCKVPVRRLAPAGR